MPSGFFELVAPFVDQLSHAWHFVHGHAASSIHAPWVSFAGVIRTGAAGGYTNGGSPGFTISVGQDTKSCLVGQGDDVLVKPCAAAAAGPGIFHLSSDGKLYTLDNKCLEFTQDKDHRLGYAHMGYCGSKDGNWMFVPSTNDNLPIQDRFELKHMSYPFKCLTTGAIKNLAVKGETEASSVSRLSSLKAGNVMDGSADTYWEGRGMDAWQGLWGHQVKLENVDIQWHDAPKQADILLSNDDGDSWRLVAHYEREGPGQTTWNADLTGEAASAIRVVCRGDGGEDGFGISSLKVMGKPVIVQPCGLTQAKLTYVPQTDPCGPVANLGQKVAVE